MNTIGIDHNLDRERIRKLLVVGLFAAILTGIGDFMLGYGHAESMENYGLAASVMASAPNLADWQMIAGGLSGFFQRLYTLSEESQMVLCADWYDSRSGIVCNSRS